MASTSEVGRAKNISNFQDLTAFGVGYGATDNPTILNFYIKHK